jgi:type IV/VI secretion system ImpK/VasF family protein
MPPPVAAPPPSLTDLCEPLFQYVCMLNRIARNPGGENIEFSALRKIIEELLADMEESAKADPRLESQFKKLKMPLIFFVDSMIAESGLSLAREWNKKRLAYDANELAGDEKFFDLLDETMKESGREAAERLAIFYTCLGLGFTGWYTGQPEFLRKKMIDLEQRIPPELIDTQHTAKVCPEAYQYLDTRNLVEPPGLKLATMGILFLGLVFIVLAVNFYLFRQASTGLDQSLRIILSHDLANPK